jgi:hypothetical protein
MEFSLHAFWLFLLGSACGYPCGYPNPLLQNVDITIRYSYPYYIYPHGYYGSYLLSANRY